MIIRRHSGDAEETARPADLAFIGVVDAAQGRVRGVIMGDVGVEGLVGAEDGAAKGEFGDWFGGFEA